jgi:cellulose synthase/poly-beta-1,6-N-acetylglucosamine synthase-like glycosyltransferase
MSGDIDIAVALLVAQSVQSLFQFFWFTLLFEVPRYFFAFVALALSARDSPEAALDEALPRRPQRISVVVVGHNEAGHIERCVRSLREQSAGYFEIVIVSDGSSDAMSKVAARLVREKLADRVLSTDLRSGKSAGINLALQDCTGDIIVNVDCDCSYDRFAIENIVRCFEDRAIGAASGDIVPRNQDASLVARFQAIEYLASISVGKRMATALDQVVCVSGAFGAFRRTALQSIGNFDVGGGEDLDVTLRLRAAGWRIAFAHDAICYTDVPARLWSFVRQRLRWERDAVRLHYRKHRRSFNPWSPRFLPLEALHLWDYMLFSVLATLFFPVYLAWLFASYGAFAIVILMSMQLGLLLLDGVMLLLAQIVTGRPVFWRYLPYLLGFSIFQSYYMRCVRLWAYIEEWMLFASTRDNYVPEKVRVIRKW